MYANDVIKFIKRQLHQKWQFDIWFSRQPLYTLKDKILCYLLAIFVISYSHLLYS